MKIACQTHNNNKLNIYNTLGNNQIYCQKCAISPSEQAPQNFLDPKSR